MRWGRMHKGIDWATPVGTAVRASCGGTVVSAGWSSGYGYCITLRHPDGRQTRYAHLSKILVSAGQHVDQNERIALSGNTGRSTGPHLHFEIRNTASERAINPLSFYSIRDRKAPSVKSIYLYAVSGGGCADLLKRVGVKVQGGGRYGAGTVGVPAGKVGVGVFATDYMEDSWNKLGVYRMTLVADSDTLFELSMDSCSFEQACLINEVKDFDAYKKKETVYRCFGNYQHRFLGIRNRNGGYIEVEKDSLVKSEYCSGR